jgi:TonB family protein
MWVRALLASAILHLGLLLSGLIDMRLAQPQLETAMEKPLEIVDERSISPTPLTPPTRSVFVESDNGTPSNKPSEQAYFGKQDQTTDTETRAAKIGKFESGTSGSSGPDALSLSDLGLNSDWKKRSGATDDNLEGIALSARTILNTRKHRYHSFYERVKDQLRVYWKPEVEERALRLAEKGSWPEGKKLETKVVVLIDSDGKIANVSTAKSCGYPEIDGAADYALQKVARFPNMPKGMIDSDGYARLYWDFILLANGSQTVRMADNSPPAVNRID